jgi:hypothetical protein
MMTEAVTVFGVVRKVTKDRPIPQSDCGSADYFLVGTASSRITLSTTTGWRYKKFCSDAQENLRPQTGRVMLFLSSQSGTHHQLRRKSNAKS